MILSCGFKSRPNHLYDKRKEEMNHIEFRKNLQEGLALEKAIIYIVQHSYANLKVMCISKKSKANVAGYK